MSRYSATITVDAAENTAAVYESISTDEAFYPENPVSMSITIDDCMGITVSSGSDSLAHLRANLNSTLRLIQAGHGAIESAKGRPRA